MVDQGASILAILKNRSKSLNIPYQQMLLLFFQEEFLRRLSKSTYVEYFVLKGGLFIYTLTHFQSRPTVDIDFGLSHLDSQLESLNIIISEIILIPTGYNHLIHFEIVKAEQISRHRKYPGVSFQIMASINQIRVPFDIDIGMGDIIVPSAQMRQIQTQLNGYDSPIINTSSIESVIAEKFDAIVQRLELTGRMKDFYDIYYLVHLFDFDAKIMGSALKETFNNRGTKLTLERYLRFENLMNDPLISKRWLNFTRNIKGQELSFHEVISSISIFLKPITKSIINEEESLLKWNSKDQQWY